MTCHPATDRTRDPPYSTDAQHKSGFGSQGTHIMHIKWHVGCGILGENEGQLGENTGLLGKKVLAG